MKSKPPWRLVTCSAVALAALLCVSILTDGVRQLWTVNLFQAGVLSVAAAWALRMIVRPYQLRGSVLLIPIGGTVLWGLLQLFTNQTVYRWETWNVVAGWTTNVILFFLALQILGVPDMQRAFRRTLLCFSFALSVVSIIQFFTSKGRILWMFSAPYADQALGPFVNRDHYASFIALVLPLALYEAVTKRRNVAAYAVMAAAMFASVIAGASRAGAILVTVEIGILLLPLVVGNPTACRAPAAGLARIAFFTAVFTAVVGCGALWERFQDPDPYRLRREMLYSSLAMVRERPWGGFGLGAWSTAYPAYALFDTGAFANHAHSDWAEWLAEGGVPFFLMLVSIFAWSVRHALRFPWGAGTVAVFLHSLVDFPLQKPPLAALMFVLLGAMAAAAREPDRTPAWRRRSMDHDGDYTPRQPVEAGVQFDTR